MNVSNDASWFKHDSNARHDIKIQYLRSVYGNSGYGSFWMIIEIMRDSNEYKIKYNDNKTIVAIARELEMKFDELKTFIDFCIDAELFETDTIYFWSSSLLKRLDKFEERKRQNQLNGTKGGRPKKQAETPVESVEIKKTIADKPANQKRDTSENETVAQYPEEITRLTGLLVESLIKNNPNAKIPDKLDKWHDSIRLMIQNDGYTVEQIKQLIVFSQNDSFWKGNILSTSKLRDKAGALILQIGRNEDKKPVSKNQRPIINTVLDQGNENELSHEEIERIRKQAREAEMVLRSQNVKND